MTLPKHLRPRWRYLAVGVEAWPDASIDRDALQRAAWAAARRLLGDPGSAAVDLSVLDLTFADGSGEAVVRARRGEVDRARAALACVDRVDDQPVGLRVRGVSGTVRACEESYLRGASGACEEETVALDGRGREAFVREDAVDVRLPGGFVAATRADLD